MESYRSEEEQVEALKRWWKENGRSTMIGVVLALGLGFGWQAWQKNQDVAAQNASNLYQQMLQALSAEEGQTSTIGRQIATELKDSHRGSVYAQFAALHLARLAVNDGEPALAEQELRWVLAMADAQDDVHQVAQLRLARVLASQDKQDEALTILQGANTDFVASYALARGDILLSQGREADALAAYESAAAALEDGAPIPQTLQDKLEYLGARLQATVAEAG
ncbi:tetratricopeptide repeat protein [Congregibacter brevis]|uniref:Ancillary SecYEG translocon subunit n=1 Tax=Congregibacter brevis TaxID=3081201 RepID=A0ABZ0IAT5_9GAMM|nr:tetratricopeptide repeat protein [Congregibacter sp. IMCC45268]